MKAENQDALRKKAAMIKLILLDVDGTLTDGQIIFSTNGEAFKSFNIKDGMGIHLAKNMGITVGLISGRCSRIVEARAKELEICYVWQGVKDKLALFRDILKEFGLMKEEVAFMGDDINDLPLLKEVGFSGAVGDAIEELKDEVDYVAERAGGRGAVREFIDFIMAEHT